MKFELKPENKITISSNSESFTGADIELTPSATAIVGIPLPYYSLAAFDEFLGSTKFPSAPSVPETPLVLDIIRNNRYWTDTNGQDEAIKLEVGTTLGDYNIDDINDAVSKVTLSWLNERIANSCKANDSNSKLSLLTTSNVEITSDLKITLAAETKFSANSNPGKLTYSYAGNWRR